MKQQLCPGLLADSLHSDLETLLHPARAYARPCDVVADPKLTLNEKRAILASWASDACAVEAAPILRRPPGSVRPVSIDAILEALSDLDKVKRRRSADGFRSLQPPARDHSDKALSH